MRHCLLLLPLVFSSPALACINDRDSDSLALQAQNFPDTLRVITGRFERNPPLYYEMRIRRSLAQLKKNPRDFGLYDDIGAAYDRLNKSDQALQIMEKKRALLPPFNAKDLRMKEAWYRYYANAGTFRAHRFLSAKPQKTKEMQTARDYIKRAIEIKPNAHFGREKYQLMAMEWIVALHERQGNKVFSLARWIEDRDKWRAQHSKDGMERKAAIEGLSGLIVLGAAWQSPDVFHALSTALDTGNGVTLRHLALRRCEEILKNGGRSLAPEFLDLTDVTYGFEWSEATNNSGIGVNDTNRKTLDELFAKLRAEADSWAGARTAYMLSRMERGQHPDTHPHFWKEWKPAAPPSLDVAWFNEKQNKEEQRQKSFLWQKMIGVALVLLVGAAILIAGLRLSAIDRQYKANFP